MNTLKILTLNTWGTRGSWDDRLQRMQTEFSRIDADIVVLQETVLTRDLDQAALMLGDGYHLVQQSGRAGRDVAAAEGITTASRWPTGQVVEVDLHVTERTGDFACACVITEVLAPDPLGRIWVANHFPDYQLDHERERRRQAVTVARVLEELVADRPGHVLLAGDMDADPGSDSIRFWTGRHVIDEMSICYRSAAEAVHGVRAMETYLPTNPFQVDQDWPFRGIDHVLVRCRSNGPSLIARSCERVFATGPTTVSDHYGMVVDYELAVDTSGIDH